MRKCNHADRQIRRRAGAVTNSDNIIPGELSCSGFLGCDMFGIMVVVSGGPFHRGCRTTRGSLASEVGRYLGLVRWALDRVGLPSTSVCRGRGGDWWPGAPLHCANCQRLAHRCFLSLPDPAMGHAERPYEYVPSVENENLCSHLQYTRHDVVCLLHDIISRSISKSLGQQSVVAKSTARSDATESPAWPATSRTPRRRAKSCIPRRPGGQKALHSRTR